MEFCRRMNATGNRSTSVNFSFHTCGTTYRAILSGEPTWETLNRPAGFIGFPRGRWWCTIHTLLNIAAGKILRISGDIILTSDFRDSFFVGEFVDSYGASAVTRTSGLAINYHLSGKCQLWPRVVSHNIYSISKRGDRSLCPTGSTVNRNMLVDTPTHVIYPGNISPIPACRDIAYVQIFVRLRGCNMLLDVIFDETTVGISLGEKFLIFIL